MNRDNNYNRDNREAYGNRREARNPFQRNSERRNEYPRANGSGGYKDWKNKTAQPEPPKEKVLTADDFPALTPSVPSARHVPDKNAWAAPEVTIADRVKDAIAKEEERRLKGQLEDKDDDKLDVLPLSGYFEKKKLGLERVQRTVERSDDRIDVIPLSSWMRSSALAKKRVEDERQRAAEEEEANYRWQISRAIVRRDSREDMEREFEAHQDNEEAEEEEFVEDAPQYEREDRR